MSDSSNGTSGGISFLGMLTILFIGLKLTHYIDWSWFWVLFPMIFGFAFIAFLLFLALVFAIIKVFLD